MSEVAACTGIQPVSTRRQRVRLGRSVAGRERWRTTADSNREPPTSSALPVELSQRMEKSTRRDRGAAPAMAAIASLRRARHRVQNLDVHNVKERGAGGAVVTGAGPHGPNGPGAREGARALSAHETSLVDGLRLVLWAICPPASAAEGEPCAGYSGIGIEPCSNHLAVPWTPEQPTATTSSRSLGRSKRPVAALGAAAICDALSIGSSVSRRINPMAVKKSVRVHARTFRASQAEIERSATKFVSG